MVINQIDRAQQFEWLIEATDPQRIAFEFVLLNAGDSHLERYLRQRGLPVRRIPYRRPLDLPRCLLALLGHWLRHPPDGVHTHLHIASFVGLVAAWLLRLPRLHTRHHSTLHHEYHPHARWRDRLINRLSHRVVAISPAVRQVLVEREGVPRDRIVLIPHGFRLEAFAHPTPERVAGLARRYNPHSKRPVVGLVSRFTAWKGVEHAIGAWPQVLARYPDALLLLANAQGDAEAELYKLLDTLPAGSWQAIRFESDIQSFYALMDVFVHVPIDAWCEAFGQTYVEAAAAGVPLVCTLSGIAPEWVRHRENAWVVPYRSAEAIAEGVLALLDKPDEARRIARQAQADVQRYDLAPFAEAHWRLYGI